MAKKLLTSPRGVAIYPRLTKPDTKFKEAGNYKTTLAVDLSDPDSPDTIAAQKLMAAIDAGVNEAVATARKNAENPGKAKKIHACEDKPYRMEEDDDGNETGRVLFTFKMLASGISKKTGKAWSRRPALFDISGQPYTDETRPNVSGGSVLRVSFEMVPFFQMKIGCGVSLRMEAVQVLRLVEWGGGDAASYGFVPEEGEMPPVNSAKTADDDDDDDEDEDTDAKDDSGDEDF